jgi:cell wall assembly regulator SMI1
MSIREILEAIYQKHKDSGIELNTPASEQEIQEFEKKIGFPLPDDFKEFYSICDGFECSEDMFRFISLQDALRY